MENENPLYDECMVSERGKVITERNTTADIDFSHHSSSSLLFFLLFFCRTGIERNGKFIFLYFFFSVYMKYSRKYLSALRSRNDFSPPHS